jgi:hypothetical protein
MKHKGKVMLAVLIPAVLISTASYACDNNAWLSTPAAQSCNIVDIHYEPNMGDSSVTYCNVTASCRTGRTVTENPNNWNSQEVTERRTTTIQMVPSGQLNRLQNISGTLTLR